MVSIVVFAALASSPFPMQVPNLGTVSPVWRDEFQGTQLDPTKWQAPTLGRQGNQSTWNPRQVFVRDGMLRLGVQRIATSGTGPRFECGAVRTRIDYDASRTLYERRFGYFEIRATLPKHLRGDHWFAFWLMSGDIRDGQTDSRRGSEIDAIETFGAWNGRLGHAVHWGGYGPTHNAFDIPSEPIANLDDGRMHTYGLWWTKAGYAIYRNGRRIAWTNARGLGNKPDRPKSQGASQEPGYLKLTVEAAPWAGPTPEWEPNPIAEDEVRVDYIRVYDLTPEDSGRG